LVAAGPRRLRAWVGLSFVAYLGYTALRSLLHWPYFSGVGFGANLLLLSFAWVCGLRLALARQPAGVALVDTRLIFALHLASAAAIQFAWRLKHQALERFVAEDLSALFLQAGALLVVYTVFARGVLVAQQPGALRSRALQWLGDVSYPLFLLHIPIYTLLSQTALRTPWAYLGVATLASAMVLALLEAVSRPRSAGPPSRTSAGIPSS
jgi:peptidoglycan/LPS O-acetylase OafA/YrhL